MVIYVCIHMPLMWMQLKRDFVLLVILFTTHAHRGWRLVMLARNHCTVQACLFPKSCFLAMNLHIFWVCSAHTLLTVDRKWLVVSGVFDSLAPDSNSRTPRTVISIRATSGIWTHDHKLARQALEASTGSFRPLDNLKNTFCFVFSARDEI